MKSKKNVGSFVMYVFASCVVASDSQRPPYTFFTPSAFPVAQADVPPTFSVVDEGSGPSPHTIFFSPYMIYLDQKNNLIVARDRLELNVSGANPQRPLYPATLALLNTKDRKNTQKICCIGSYIEQRIVNLAGIFPSLQYVSLHEMNMLMGIDNVTGALNPHHARTMLGENSKSVTVEMTGYVYETEKKHHFVAGVRLRDGDTVVDCKGIEGRVHREEDHLIVCAYECNNNQSIRHTLYTLRLLKNFSSRFTVTVPPLS